MKKQNSLLERVPTPTLLEEAFLRLGIQSMTFRHPPVFHVGEDADFIDLIPGGHTKNLFLKDKKGQLFLVTTLQETSVNLKTLAEALGYKAFSFASALILKEILGVEPGSVTPLALINDRERKVLFVLDQKIMVCEKVNCHPLKNDYTTNMTPTELLNFIQDLGYQPLIFDFEGEKQC